MFIPLWRRASPHLDLGTRRRPVVAALDPQADRAVGEVDELVLAQRGDPRPGDRDRLGVALDVARGRASRASRSRSSATSSRSSPIRIFGPGRSPSTATSRPTRPAAARIASIVPAWRSRSAWEKLSRKTSTPASISRSSTSGSQLAGPTVAMIFVRLPARRASVVSISPPCVADCREWGGVGESARRHRT